MPRARRKGSGGAHRNPPRVLWGDVMSEHVQALVYRHVDDGQLYVHGFADAPITLRTERGALTIRGLSDATGVMMLAEPDGSIRLVRKDGAPLWQEFDP